MDLRRIYPFEFKEIWDIGAHKGETTTYFRSKFVKSKIRSFEPIAENFRILHERCANTTNHDSYQLALGDEVKTVKIHLQNASVIHSLRPDLNVPSSSNPKTEEVNQTTVDLLFDKFNCSKIDVLKIDVEGYELEVLEGAKDALESRRIKAILAECDFDPKDTQHTYFNDLWDHLRSKNFSFFGLYDVIHYGNGLGIGFCNALFIERTVSGDGS